MADSPAFDLVCDEIEERTSIDRLSARGTVRLALRKAGLEARDVTRDQMTTVVQRLLPDELATRGAEQSAQVCEAIRVRLAGLAASPEPDGPQAIFERFGGGA